MATGDRTPNMSVYKPAPGETVYDPAFSSGLDKIDAHDHTGAPDKGVQIPTDGLVDGCVTPPKLSLTYFDKIIGDQGSGIVPDANNDATITGDVVANGTHAKPVYHDDTAASASTLDVQLTKAVTVGAKTVNDVGLASFDSAAFAVDSATGHVTLAGGGGSPAVLTIIGDEGSGNVPDGSGQITITGDVVANGTHAKAVYLDDTAASASTLDVQLATAVAAASAATTDVGLASFDSADFGVDSNGNVTFSGTGGGVPTNVDWFDDMNYTSYQTFSSDGEVWGTSTTATTAQGVAEHFGVAQSAASAGGGVIFTGECVKTGGSAITIDWGFKMGSATVGASQHSVFGLTDSTASPQFTHNNVIWFEAITSATNWFIRAKNSGTSTTLDTGTAVDTNWNKFTLVINSAGSSVEGFVNDVSVGTVATNLPATSTALRLYWGSTNNTAVNWLDWVRFRQTRGS